MDRPIKIGFISPYDHAFHGGVSDHINRLANQFRAWGHAVRIVAPCSSPDTIEDEDFIPMGQSEGRKWAYIRLEGTSFGDVPLNAELKLEVWDSPNSAGVVIDAIRCIKIAKDRGMSGPLIGPSSYFMKSPPVQYTDDEAKQKVENFIQGLEA